MRSVMLVSAESELLNLPCDCRFGVCDLIVEYIVLRPGELPRLVILLMQLATQLGACGFDGTYDSRLGFGL